MSLKIQKIRLPASKNHAIQNQNPKRYYFMGWKDLHEKYTFQASFHVRHAEGLSNFIAVMSLFDTLFHISLVRSVSCYMLTKGLSIERLGQLTYMLGIIDIHSPT